MKQTQEYTIRLYYFQIRLKFNQRNHAHCVILISFYIFCYVAVIFTDPRLLNSIQIILQVKDK